MRELWLEIVDYPGYSVSTEGRVRNDRFDRLVALRRNQGGSIYVGLFVDGRQRNVIVSKLVMRAFLDNPFADRDINVVAIHKDGDQSNNHVDNLAPRPRWYAMEYQRQFPVIRIQWLGEVIERDTGLKFHNSFAASVYFGVIDLHILTSILHESTTPVIPYNFRRLNQN